MVPLSGWAGLSLVGLSKLGGGLGGGGTAGTGDGDWFLVWGTAPKLACI